MRIGVVGAGAVGGYLAARLARAGRDVAVVARGAHLGAIRAGGLALETPDEGFAVEVPASSDPADLGERDLYLVTVKHPALPAVAAMLAPHLGPGTRVAFAMNGLHWYYGQGFRPLGRDLPAGRLDPDGAVARAIGAERSLGIVVRSPNEVVRPGVVRNRARDNRLVVGEAVPGGDAAAAVAEALGGCGFAVEAVPEIRRPMWAKVAGNLALGPVAGLTGSTEAAILADPGTRDLVLALFREALAVAAAHGFAFPEVDPAAVLAPGDHVPDHKPSMLQDLERGRPVEADAIVAIVRDLARDAGVATPAIDLVLPLLLRRAAVATDR